MGDELDLLAVGAHPDDAELGCGGTLLLAVDEAVRVGIADLTGGEAATLGNPELRDVERRRAAAILGLAARPCLGLPDASVGTEPSHREAVIDLIRETRPRVVLAPFPHDRHPDHAAAGRLVLEASFLAGLPALGRGRPHRPGRVFHYMLHHTFEPSFVVDISSVWERKLEAIEAYRSQFGPPSPGQEAVIDVGRFLEVMEARARVLGAMIGVRFGEGFFTSGPVGLSALPGLDRGRGPAEPSYQLFS
jgi:bacillithiol biosynthesis deacetylase BshB1